jgi:hypothetical protein
VIRRAILLLILGAALIATPSISAEEDPRPAPRPAVALTMPREGMAVVPLEFQLRATPSDVAQRLRATVQVRSAEQGWVALTSVPLDRRGRGDGLLVSNRPGSKDYRAVLVSARGRVVAASPTTTVTWAKLVHSVDLACGTDSAPVSTRVACTIAVTPAVRLDDMVVSLQLHGRTQWINLESFRVPDRGVIRTDVVGRATGNVQYRAILMHKAELLTESAVVTISYA